MTTAIFVLVVAAEIMFMIWLCRRTYFLVTHMTALEEFDPNFDKAMQILVSKLILQLIYILIMLATILATFEVVWRWIYS